MKIAHRIIFAILFVFVISACGEKTSSIEGTLLDGQGKPIRGVTVVAKQVQPTQGFEQFETKTGNDGVFRLTGLMPSSDYTIAPLSDRWGTSLSQTIRTLEAGQNQTLPAPIRIRFQAMRDGTYIDTKTDLQWSIQPVKELTVDSVVDYVSALDSGGFTDWKLPTREQLATLEDKAPAKPGAEAPFIQKTCCAWVLESDIVDWKFYTEETNEFWKSNTDTPDNRVIVVRDSKVAATVAAALVEKPAPEPAAVTPPAEESVASVTQPAPTPSAVKLEPGVRYASRKECAEKRAKEDEVKKAAAPPAPAPITAVPAPPPPPATVAAKPAPATTKPAAPAPAAVATIPGKQADSITLYFPVGSSRLSPQELVRLKTFYSEVRGKKGKILIEGHCDETRRDDATANLRLSLDRAYDVASSLKNMGLSHRVVNYELRGLGGNSPVATNDTAEGRNLNRRVEVTFTEQ